MLRFHQVNKVAYGLYAQGYLPADVQDYYNKNKPLDKEHP